MSKVLPVAIHDRPELNLKQGIKSSLNHWRQLLATLYIYYCYSRECGNSGYCKEIIADGKKSLLLSDGFAQWVSQRFTSIPNVQVLIKDSPLFSAQIEHLQVGLGLFLKLAQVEYVDKTLPFSSERTGGNRFAKSIHFSTNMMLIADVISSFLDDEIVEYLNKWLSGMDDTKIGPAIKSILVTFTEECQFKMRTESGEIFFQQDGVYDQLRDSANTVESSDIHEMVGPFRILKSYVKEGMHPYLSDGKDGFSSKLTGNDFAAYADMVRVSLSLIPKRTTVYQETNVQAPVFRREKLSYALQLFKKNRTSESWINKGLEINARQRDYFGKLDSDKLKAFGIPEITELFCGKKNSDGNIELELMWSGKPGQGWSSIKPEDETTAKSIASFLSKLKASPEQFDFCASSFEKPSGFGKSVLTELLMKFHPDKFIKHGKVSFEVLSFLDLIDFAWSDNFTDNDYQQVLGAAAKISSRMSEIHIPRSINLDGTEDNSPPDYLTVNEFIWFIKNNQEDIMKIQLKEPSGAEKQGTKKLSQILSADADDLMNRLVAALMTKPFAILAGASGTGKSRMAKKLAYMTCLNEQLQEMKDDRGVVSKPLENFCMIPVKPNWHDSSELIGYKSAIKERGYVTTPFVNFILKAHCFPDTPFIVCLDEMNLAPVEHYFAEYLSASEGHSEYNGKSISNPIIEASVFDNDISNIQMDGYVLPPDAKKMIEEIGLCIPDNLFIVGTVNMDDTISQFSRKVLDRAMTIAMDDDDIDYADLQKDKYETLSMDLLLEKSDIVKFSVRNNYDPEKLVDGFRDVLGSLKKKLSTTPFAIAYRFAIETVLYREALKNLPIKGDNGEAAEYDKIAIDHMILMKVLPRITGTLTDRSTLLSDLESFIKVNLNDKGLSKKAQARMVEAAGHNGGYLSFWP